MIRIPGPRIAALADADQIPPHTAHEPEKPDPLSRKPRTSGQFGIDRFGKTHAIVHIDTAPVRRTDLLRGCLRAFWVGGLICTLGQGMIWLFQTYLQLEFVEAAGMASVVLVVIAAILTGVGIYDVIGQYAGAGSVIPITGFSNSIVSPAMEFKREGLIGIGANLFKIAGPVLVNGISASMLYGVVFFLFGR